MRPRCQWFLPPFVHDRLVLSAPPLSKGTCNGSHCLRSTRCLCFGHENGNRPGGPLEYSGRPRNCQTVAHRSEPRQYYVEGTIQPFLNRHSSFYGAVLSLGDTHQSGAPPRARSVSYTHLTLPTIYSV